MRHHVAVASEAFTTRTTVVVLDSRVRGDVSGEIAARDESLVADLTDLVTDSRVDLLVLLEVSEGCELFTAYLTLEGLLARVSAKMNGEIMFLCKSSGT